MSKDAKLGLVLGIGLIIIIAVVFFRKDPALAREPGSETTAAAVKQKNALTTPVISDVRLESGKWHTVADGDTLFNLAQRYYNNSARFGVIYDANRDRLTTPDRLEPGTVLIIPD